MNLQTSRSDPSRAAHPVQHRSFGPVRLAIGAEYRVREIRQLKADVVDLVHAVVHALDGGHSFGDMAGHCHARACARP